MLDVEGDGCRVWCGEAHQFAAVSPECAFRVHTYEVGRVESSADPFAPDTDSTAVTLAVPEDLDVPTGQASARDAMIQVGEWWFTAAGASALTGMLTSAVEMARAG